MLSELVYLCNGLDGQVFRIGFWDRTETLLDWTIASISFYATYGHGAMRIVALFRPLHTALDSKHFPVQGRGTASGVDPAF